MDNKIVTARFATDDNYVNVYDVYQWDYGQVLRIEGLKLPNMVEIHFSLQETSGEAKTRIGVTKDGVTDVVIPDSFLENSGIGDNYKIFAWIYVADKDSGRTEYKITIHIKARAKPEISHGGQDGEVFQEAVEAVRDAAKRAAESEKQAERWAVGRVDVPGSETDNSKFYSEESKKNAQQTTKDKEAVEELVKKTENIGQLAEEVKANVQKASESAKNAETSATNASVSEKNAKTSESNASTSETNAKASETNAKASEQAVEKSKQTVDKTVADFGQAVTNASAALKSEKDAHVKAITTAGTTETKRVTDEGAKQVQTVQSTGAQETEKVTAEGTKQVGLVKTEGEKHLAAVQTAAQEIVADREQIQKNKTDIAELRQNKADAIVESVSGTLLNVKDSSGAFFEDFSMPGKTIQDGTPTPDVPVSIVNAGESENIEIKVTGKNLIPFPYPDIKEAGKTVNHKGVDYTVLQDGGVHLKGTPQDAFGLNICTIPFKDYGTIKVSDLIFYDPNNNKTFFYPQKYIGKAIDMVVYPQVECGTVTTDYEPYKEPQTLTLQLDRPLTKWDRLEKREGMWGIARNGDRKILDGTEIWYRYTLYENDRLYCYCAEGIKSEIGYQKSYCTHFKNKNSVWLSQKGKYGEYSDHETLSNKYFISDKPTVEDFKAWLAQQKEAGTPVELVYKTAEETWEPLLEEMQLTLNALYTNYPTTVVSNSEDTEMQLTYVADTKNYYLNREQVLQRQILDIQNALISQKISGGGIKVTNSAKLPFVKFSVFGKSEQVQTTGKNLLDIESGVLKGWNIEQVTNNFTAGETYTFSVTTLIGDTTKSSCGLFVEFEDGAEKRIVTYKNINTSETFVFPDGKVANIKLCGGHEGSVDKTCKIQIEKGEIATSYEPYTGGKPSPSIEYPQEITSCGENSTIDLKIAGDNAEPQELTLPTPNGLPGLKVNSGGNYTDENGQQWVTDEIDLARGKYVQRIAKKIFNGTEQLSDNLGAKTSLWLRIDNIEPETGLCNYGKIVKINAKEQEELSFSITSSGIYLYTTKQKEDFIEELKQKYDIGKSVEVLYALKTPVETDLPTETTAAFKTLHTNYPTTLVSNNADAGMELTYTVDTQSYVDSKIATLSKAIL